MFPDPCSAFGTVPWGKSGTKNVNLIDRTICVFPQVEKSFVSKMEKTGFGITVTLIKIISYVSHHSVGQGWDRHGTLRDNSPESIRKP